MTDERNCQAGQIVSRLQRHARIRFQDLINSDQDLDRLKETMPQLVPFSGRSYTGLVPVLDWDHRLPSKTLLLRVYAFYTEDSLRAGVAELNARTGEIEAHDKFPEFDVLDYAGLDADEAYEADVENDGTISRVRLVSPWRREIEAETSRLAVKIARSSAQFKQLLAESHARPDYLGDLEAVSWTPPCESEHDGWTIDCWYLLYLDASVGKGRSFLIDVKGKEVIGVREFVVRSS